MRWLVQHQSIETTTADGGARRRSKPLIHDPDNNILSVFAKTWFLSCQRQHTCKLTTDTAKDTPKAGSRSTRMSPAVKDKAVLPDQHYSHRRAHYYSPNTKNLPAKKTNKQRMQELTTKVVEAPHRSTGCSHKSRSPPFPRRTCSRPDAADRCAHTREKCLRCLFRPWCHSLSTSWRRRSCRKTRRSIAPLSLSCPTRPYLDGTGPCAPETPKNKKARGWLLVWLD